jgi:serine/threonine protein kinase/WD40 repeat protein
VAILKDPARGPVFACNQEVITTSDEPSPAGRSNLGGDARSALAALWALTFTEKELHEGNPSISYRRALPGTPTTDVPPPGPESPKETVTLPAPATRPPAWRAGGDYSLENEIGRGGMGVVFRARQAGLDREVAVKRIRADRDSEEARERFLSEARTTGFLGHPNIVPVHQLGQTAEGELFLAMKLVGGIPWSTLLHPGGAEEAPRDLERHLRILVAVANAVGFAHSRGIIHRDLKPENVIVGEYGEVLVMDWGLAVDVSPDPPAAPRATHRSSLKGAVAGTPCYMAPEMAEGRSAELGPRTDVFLLGAILHEILTGRPPHRGRTVASVLGAAVRCGPFDLGAEAPAELASICRRALAPSPGERWESARAFKEAVEAYLAHRESTRISDAAERTLVAADPLANDRHRLYADLAEALSAMRQALVLWPGNDAAASGERRARIAYASAASARGDLGLAETLLAPLPASDTEAAKLRAEVVLALRKLRKRERTARALKIGLALAAALLVAETTHAESERRRAEAESFRAEAESVHAAAERLHAEVERRRAEKSALEARAERDRAQGALARTLEIRATAALAENDLPLALALFAEANRRSTSYRARANAAFCLERTAHLEGVTKGPPVTLVRNVTGNVAVVNEAVWPHEEGERFLALSPDRRHYLTLVRDGLTSEYARVRSLPDGTVVGSTAHLLQLATGSFDVGFSADGSEVLAREQMAKRTLKRWRVEGWVEREPLDLKLLRGEIPSEYVEFLSLDSIATSSDGEHLYVGENQLLLDLELPRGPLKVLALFDSGRQVRKLEELAGQDVLAGALSDGTVHFVDTLTGKALPDVVTHRDVVVDWDTSPNGREWVTASRDGTARVWEVPGHRPTGVVVRGEGPLSSARFASGSTLLVATEAGVVSSWTIPRGQGRSVRRPGVFSSQALAPGGRRFLVVNSLAKTTTIHDAGTLKAVGNLGGTQAAAFRVTFSADGSRAAVFDGSLSVIDLEDPRELARFELGLDVPVDDAVEVTALTSARWLVRDRTQRRSFLLDVDARSCEPLPWPCAAAGKLLVTWRAGALRVRDVASGDELREEPAAPPVWIEASHGGSEVACLMSGGHVSIRSLPGLAEQDSFAAGERARALTFSPSDRTIAIEGTGARWDRARRVHFPEADPSCFGLARWERAGDARVHASEDGDRCVLTTREGAVLFDLVQARARPLPPAEMARFSKDGRSLVVASGNTAGLHDSSTGEPRGKLMVLPGPVDDALFVDSDRAVAFLCRSAGVALFDVASGDPIGTVLPAPEGAGGSVSALQWSWDAASRRLLVASIVRVRVFSLDFLSPGDVPPDELVRRASRATGISIDERGEVHVLGPEEWQHLGR